MTEKLLKILEENARLSNKDIAVMLGVTEKEVADEIKLLEDVESIYLMSGAFDLTVLVTDKSFHEVAMFVAQRLSPLEGVVSTATHFILKKYKENGVFLTDEPRDDRGNISL